MSNLRNKVLVWLEDHVPASRIRHILGVEALAKELAEHYQLDPEKAGKAGLMHDLAKYFKPKKLLKMAKKAEIKIDPVFEKNPHLLHADVSAIVAKKKFKIKDTEILNAIRHHTLGEPDMGELSCVVFIADALEPGRGDTPQLNQLRQSSRENLYKGVWQTSDYSLQHLLDQGRVIHPRTVMTRNWAMFRYREERRRVKGLCEGRRGDGETGGRGDGGTGRRGDGETGGRGDGGTGGRGDWGTGRRGDWGTGRLGDGD